MFKLGCIIHLLLLYALDTIVSLCEAASVSFNCTSNVGCIPQKAKCDGHWNCANKEDEMGCEIGKLFQLLTLYRRLKNSVLR